MVQFGHQLRADLPAKPCLACGEQTQWIGSYEPLPGLRVERNLCDKCVDAGRRVGGFIGMIIQGIIAYRAGLAARKAEQQKNEALCGQCGQAECAGHGAA